MAKLRFTTAIGIFVGVCGIWFAYLLFREVERPLEFTSEAASASLVASGGAMILFGSAGFLFLSFTSEKVRVNRKGVRVIRSPLTVVISCFLSAMFLVMVAFLSTYLTIFGKPDGSGGFLILLSFFSIPLAGAVLATAVSALAARSWYPSITFDGTTLVVQTVGVRRSYSPAAGVVLVASEVTGVSVRGRTPQSIKRGLVSTVLSMFGSVSSSGERDAAVATIRVNQRELDALTSKPAARREGVRK